MKAKKTLKILAVCLVLAMAVAMSVSAVTYNTVNLSKTMYYVSGAANSFTSDQATYYGHTFATSDYACQIYLFGKTEDGNTGVSSRILDIGESIGSGEPSLLAATVYCPGMLMLSRMALNPVWAATAPQQRKACKI